MEQQAIEENKINIDQIYIEEKFKSLGYIHKGNDLHNFFVGKAGAVFFREDLKTTVFVKKNYFHIARDNKTLFSGDIYMKNDLEDIIRICQIR
jgi:hypothetical protein